MAGTKSAEIYLYDEIGDSFFGGITAKQFADDLNALGKIDRINVRINSPGGDVFQGLAIYNTLKRHPANVVVDIDGMALSIASIIAMAGNTINMAKNAMFMIHDPWGFTGGTAEDFRKQADLLDQVKENLVNTYVDKTGMDSGQINLLMSEETWMQAEEAKRLGFISNITEELQMAAGFNLSRFKKPPQVTNVAPLANPWRAKIAAMKRV
jgi:ATP-dependent Clp endopeptidase proteolytic subunit ClpP